MSSLAWLLAAGLLTTGPVVQAPTAATPGPRPSLEHDRLDALAGTWRFEKNTSLAGKPPERTTGVSENRWILENRYLECRAREGDGGSLGESLLIYGFDTRRRAYFTLAMASRGTSYRNLEGFYDEPTKSLVLLGKDPGDGRTSGVKLRQVLTIESRDRHRLELFLIPRGKLPQKVVEIVYTRE